MKAIVYTKYGGPEVLQLKELGKPEPANNEVLVKVFAASLNDWDYGLVEGTTFVNRLFFGLLRPARQIPGSDIAGRVEAVGKNVKKFKCGDEVFGDLSGRWGGFAGYVCAREDKLALKSPQMSFEEAAAIPQAAMLAVQGLIDIGKISKGQRLLINGAGGGVGTFAIQIARLFDAEITAVDAPGKLDMLRALGASTVIDYTRQDFTRLGRRYDLILDVKTDRPAFDYARVLSPQGRYVTVGGTMPRILQTLLLGPYISLTKRKKMCIVGLKANKDLAYINELFERGKLKPVIDGKYRLTDVPEAFRLFGKGAHKGKIVISMAD